MEREWRDVQRILGPIEGIATIPPSNLITPKYTSGALMGNGDIGVVAGDPLASQQTFHFGKSDFWGTHWNERHNAPEISILSLGSLTISSPTSGDHGGYRVVQDILHAQVKTTIRIGGAEVHLRSWTAEGDNLFLTEVTSKKKNGSVPVQLTLSMPAPDAASHAQFPAAAGEREGMLWADRENNLTGPSDYKARAAVGVRMIGVELTDFHSLSPTSISARFNLSDKPVWIVAALESSATTAASNTPAKLLVKAALNCTQAVTQTRIEDLEKQHLQWWKNFWLRSYVDLHDQLLEDYYYGALYVLGVSSRPGKLPPSLWGNFVTTDNAAWGGRYFMNYNEEAAYYGVFSSNRPELVEPYNRMIFAQIPWQRNRTADAGYQGVSFQRTFSPFTVLASPPAPIPVAAIQDYHKLPSDQKSNATFSLLPVIQYYEYTQDRKFLRTQLYPAMKQLDAFWRDFAVRSTDGKHWNFEHSSAHEGGDDLNPNLDIGFASRIERELIQTSKVLGVDRAMRPIWQSFLDQLSPYPSGVVNGKKIYYIAASVKNDIKNQGLFEPGDQPINLEGLVYPGENLSIGGDPHQLEVARNSMQEMNSWSVTKGGNSNNGFCKIFPIAARIGWPADDLIAKLKAAILYQWRPSNLTVFQGGGGIETSGSIEAINSMLLQHEDHVLRVFPDWPRSQDASFTHLRAKGAFLISSRQTGGSIPEVEIQSERGGPITMQSPWGDRSVLINHRPQKPDPKGQLHWTTTPGKNYHLIPQ